jgi:hypothetical protein
VSPTTVDLLRLLGPGGASGVQATQGAAPGQVAGADFASLLQQARQGQLASGRQVTVARGSGLNLSADQLQKISVAADQAEAQGATRALVFMDGMALRLDVGNRQVMGAVDPTKPGVMTGLDAVVTIPSTGADAGQAAVKPLPRSSAIGSPSLLKALMGSDQQQ